VGTIKLAPLQVFVLTVRGVVRELLASKRDCLLMIAGRGVC